MSGPWFRRKRGRSALFDRAMVVLDPIIEILAASCLCFEPLRMFGLPRPQKGRAAGITALKSSSMNCEPPPPSSSPPVGPKT